MKDKILLLGDASENSQIVEEYLLEKYRVQRCSMVTENVEGMMKIMHPDLVVATSLGADQVSLGIFRWLREEHGQTPILIVCTEEYWNKFSPVYEWIELETLFMPIEKDELLLKSSVMIDTARSEAIDRQKILIVDDNTIVLRNIRQILKDKYEIFLAKSGKQAIKAVVTDEIDLILLDYEMPEMNGEETYVRLREMEHAKNIPVIFLTGVSDREKIVKALKLNPAGYVLKPVKQNKLLSVIEEVLNEEGQKNEILVDEIIQTED